MRKAILVSIFLLAVVLSLFFALKKHYSFNYYYSTNNQVVTLIHYYSLLEPTREESYLTYGYIRTEKELENYIEIPRVHQFILHWESDICVVYTPDLPYITKGKVEKIKLKEPSHTQWKMMKEDITGEYIHIYAW